MFIFIFLTSNFNTFGFFQFKNSLNFLRKGFSYIIAEEKWLKIVYRSMKLLENMRKLFGLRWRDGFQSNLHYGTVYR